MARNFSKKIFKLYLLGDSNTQKAFAENGFACRLSDEYIRKFDVVNRGFSGYTSDYLRIILPDLLKQDNFFQDIHTTTLLIGSNDANLKEEDDRHVPIERYEDNLEFLIKTLKEENKISNIILLSPPPVDGFEWNLYCERFQNRTTNVKTEHVLPYADICKKLSLKHDLMFIDLYHDMLKMEDWKEFFHDGLHFSVKGNDYVFERLKQLIDPLTENLNMFYPDWKTFKQEIDGN